MNTKIESNRENNNALADYLIELAKGIKNRTIKPINNQVTQDLHSTDNNDGTIRYYSCKKNTLYIEYSVINEKSLYDLVSDNNSENLETDISDKELKDALKQTIKRKP